MKRCCYLLVILFNFVFTQVFTDVSFVSSRSIGMAGSIVSNPKGEESVFYNPAGLVSSNKISFLCGYNNLYNLDFIKQNYFSIQIPSHNSNHLSYNTALSFQSLQTSYSDDSNEFGSYNEDLSRETVVSLSQGIVLLNDRHSTLSVGYNLNYFIFYQSPSAGVGGNGLNGISEGESETYGLDIGIHSSLRNKIKFGAFIKNITSTRLGSGSSLTFLPRRLNIGVGYTPYPDLSTNFSLDRFLNEKRSSFRFGFEYLVNKYFEVRSGIQMSENNNRFGLGFSLYLPYVNISYGILTHPILDNVNTLEIKVSFE